MVSKEFVIECFQQSWGVKVIGCKAVNLDCIQILQRINPGRVAFFGNIYLSAEYFWQKAGVLDPHNNSSILATSFQKSILDVIWIDPTKYYTISPDTKVINWQTEFNNLLFEDLRWNKDSLAFPYWYLNGSVSHLEFERFPIQWSKMLKNATLPFDSSLIPTGSVTIYAPNALRFVGYMCTIGN